MFRPFKWEAVAVEAEAAVADFEVVVDVGVDFVEAVDEAVVGIILIEKLN